MGKCFRSVLDEARDGELVITFKPHIRPRRRDVDRPAEVGDGVNVLPSVSKGVVTTIHRRQKVVLKGTVAWNKVVTEMKLFEKARK